MHASSWSPDHRRFLRAMAASSLKPGAALHPRVLDEGPGQAEALPLPGAERLDVVVAALGRARRVTLYRATKSSGPATP